MWFLFTHVFSCAIVLGSIPTKCPGMALARSALSHLESACSLFEDVSENARAAKVLPVLRKLKGRAMTAMSDLSCRASPGYSPAEDSNAKDEDELATLGGKTRLVSRKSPSAPSSPHDSFRRQVAAQAPVPQAYPPNPYFPDSTGLTVVDSPPQQWQGYQPTENPYAYPALAGQWQPEQGFNDMDPTLMNLDVSSLQYNGYGQVPLMSGSYIPSQLSMDSPVQGRTPASQPDPDVSWHNLYTQFNQV